MKRPSLAFLLTVLLLVAIRIIVALVEGEKVADQKRDRADHWGRSIFIEEIISDLDSGAIAIAREKLEILMSHTGRFVYAQDTDPLAAAFAEIEEKGDPTMHLEPSSFRGDAN